MADVLIRQANINDVDAIFEIEHLCFPDPWSKDSLRYELGENPRAFYIVAEIDGSVVGYAGLWWIEDEGHITNVAVRPGYRSRKIDRFHNEAGDPAPYFRGKKIQCSCYWAI